MDWIAIVVIVLAVVLLIVMQARTGAGSQYICTTPRDKAKGSRLKGELSDLKNDSAGKEHKDK